MPDTILIRRGLSAADAPIPLPEFALGNVVKLKKPYAPDAGHSYEYGIIVEHLHRNAFGHPRVSLHLWTTEGKMYLIPDCCLPVSVDFCVCEIVVVTIAATDEVLPGGFDCFPTCPACGGKEQHPFDARRCPECHGWGHVAEMVRIHPTEAKNDE